MRRFLLHVLPSGFHRIRHYGLLANANRKHDIATARALRGVDARHRDFRARSAYPRTAAFIASTMSIRRSPHRASPSAPSSNQADTNAHCHGCGCPAFLHATTAKTRFLPTGHCKPRRSGRRFGPAIKLAEPTASVQIPIAPRHR